MMHLGHQPRGEIYAMTLDELYVESTELTAWVRLYNGQDESGSESAEPS